MHKGSYCITSPAQNFITFPWATDNNFFCLLTDFFFSSLMDVRWVLINKQTNKNSSILRTTMWPWAPVNWVWNNKVHLSLVLTSLSLFRLQSCPTWGSQSCVWVLPSQTLFWLCCFVCFFLQQDCSSFPRLGPSLTPSIKIFCLSKFKQCNQFFRPHLAENFLSACFILSCFLSVCGLFSTIKYIWNG